jgi:UDP-N-acetyl-D-galactosamine dehydrogenase
VPDLRNSKLADVISELRAFGCDPRLHDPCAAPGETAALYGAAIVPLMELRDLDALLLAVPRQACLAGAARPAGTGLPERCFGDIRGALQAGVIAATRPDLTCWSL